MALAVIVALSAGGAKALVMSVALVMLMVPVAHRQQQCADDATGVNAAAVLALVPVALLAPVPQLAPVALVALRAGGADGAKGAGDVSGAGDADGASGPLATVVLVMPMALMPRQS